MGQLKDKLQWILQRLQPWIAPPTFPDDQEKTRIAAMLNTILLIMLILIGGYAISAQLITPNLPRFIETIIFILVALWLRGILRRGKVYQAGFVLTFALWAMISIGIYAFGGLEGTSLSSYFGIVLIAGLLMGGRMAAIFAGLSILSSFLIVYAEEQGFLPPPPAPVTLMSSWLEFAITVVGVTGLLYLADRNLKRALAKVRHHERELARKAAETQELAQAAIEANEFKSRLIARMSHELRTPLGAIRGLTEMLHYAAFGPVTPKQKEMTQKIIRHSEHLKGLIGELLEQSQYESGNVRLAKAPFCPEDIVEQVRITFYPLAREKGLEIRTEVEDDFPPILVGDPEKITQILSSLVSNGIKFTEKGGVTVRLYRPNPEYWGLDVIDTGIGIPEQACVYVFEPFRQIDESVTREYGGIGLGLALVKELTLLMQGKVELKSEVGQGSTFTVHLPLELPTEERSEQPETSVAQGVR